MPLTSEKWLHDFVLPLTAGGDVRISGVIGQVELEKLLTAPLDRADSGLRVAEARQAVMAELLIDPAPPELDSDSIRLAAAVQALLFLSHPAIHAASVRKSRLKALAHWAAETATLQEPSGVRALVERHSMLHHLFDLARDDVRVSFWVGKREFRGSEPPARLLKWPELRRVREERWRTPFVTEAVADPGQRAIVAALLSASPLTDLLEPARLDPSIELSPLARFIREPVIARAVADRWLSIGLTQIAGPFAAALIALCSGKLPEACGTWVRFACHLHLLLLAGRREPRTEASAWMAELNALTQGGQPALKDFFGLFAAAQRTEAGRPDDLGLNPKLARQVDVYAAACTQLCGATRTDELHGMLSRGLTKEAKRGLA
jgi:hypothetical protein